MIKHQTMISSEYCLHWSAEDSVREFLTNALDSDGEFSWSYDTMEETFKITSKDTTLPLSALALGVSSNRGKEDSVGQFGEGMTVSCVVALREGLDLVFINGNKIWTPILEWNENLGIETLCILEDINPDQDNKDFTVVIKGVTSDMFDTVEQRCLYLRCVDVLVETSHGDVIEEEGGKVYVGGIYVTSDSDLKYSYDFKPKYLKLNRDRQSVSSWDLHGATSQLWLNSDEPDLVMGMLQEDCVDVKHVEHSWVRNDSSKSRDMVETLKEKAIESWKEDKKIVIDNNWDDAPKHDKFKVTGTVALNELLRETTEYQEFEENLEEEKEPEKTLLDLVTEFRDNHYLSLNKEQERDLDYIIQQIEDGDIELN